MSLTPFEQRINRIAVDGALCVAMGLAVRLDLFDALVELGSKENPVTAQQVADRNGLKERYVRELLSALACADILGVTPDEKFYVEDENVKSVQKSSRASCVMETAEVSHLAAVANPLLDVFQKDGPPGLPYSLYQHFYSIMNDLTVCWQDKHFLSGFMPALPFDIEKRLKEGDLRCLDVGCGTGYHFLKLAEHYPKNTFVGIDFSESALDIARGKTQSNGAKFENLTFENVDAGKMPEEWTNSFDWVTIFDACHDQMRPDLCLLEIHRVLKPGGVFSMLEIKGTSNVYNDKKEIGECAAYLYSVSTLHCLPVGSNSPDALGLGTMWGERRARELLQKAGFDDIQIVAMPFFPVNAVYVCQK